MNWTNIMSSKGQVYAKKAVDFISKTEGPVYFEQVTNIIEIKLLIVINNDDVLRETFMIKQLMPWLM